MTNSVNWADVIEEAKSGGGGFEPVPDGDYDLLITGATASLTQNQKPMFTIETTIQGGPSNGRKIWDRLIVSADNGKAMGFFFSKMAAIGLPVEFFKTQPSDDAIVQQLLNNRHFRAQVGKNNYNPQKPGNEIKKYYPASGGPSFAPSAPAPAQGGFPPPPAAAPQVAPAVQQQYAAPPAAPPVAAPPAYAPPAPAAPPAYAAPPAPPAPPAASPWEQAGGQTPPPSPF